MQAHDNNHPGDHTEVKEGRKISELYLEWNKHMEIQLNTLSGGVGRKVACKIKNEFINPAISHKGRYTRP